jgi:epoxyqueuosine reductase QueG
VKNFGRFEADPAMSLWHNTSKGGVAPTKICPEDRLDHTGKNGCGRLVPVSMMVCPWCKYEWLTDNQVYFAELELLVENKNTSEMTISEWAASKKLEGWTTNRILVSIMVKNPNNMKKAFLEAIKSLRTDKCELISPQYYYFIKKYILKK